MSVIFDKLPCGVVLASPDGLITSANAEFLRMLGYQKGTIVNKKKWQDLLSMGGKIYHETHYGPLMKMQGDVREVNFDFVKSDGTKMPVVINAVHVKGSTIENDYITMIICPMYQRKQYEKELMIAKKAAEDLVDQLSIKNAELDKFAYVVSHDLKSPLSNIMGLSSLLKDEYASKLDDDGVNILAHIEKSVEKLKRFIDDILAYYKGDKMAKNEKDTLFFTEFMVNLKDLLDSNNKYNIVFPTHNPVIVANKIVMEQIFINLITNSVKYNDKETVNIEITVSENNNFYHFSVKDNGIGISQKDQDKIFQLFTNLGRRDRNGDLGTGIGLATIKKIVEQEGGTIAIESTLGKGMNFMFTLKKQR